MLCGANGVGAAVSVLPVVAASGPTALEEKVDALSGQVNALSGQVTGVQDLLKQQKVS